MVNALDDRDVWRLLDYTLDDYIAEYTFESELERQLVSGLQVRLIRQDADLIHHHHEGASSISSTPFSDNAFVNVTSKLRQILHDASIPHSVAELYVVAEIAICSSYRDSDDDKGSASTSRAMHTRIHITIHLRMDMETLKSVPKPTMILSRYNLDVLTA